jgi:hypothetical protein
MSKKSKFSTAGFFCFVLWLLSMHSLAFGQSHLEVVKNTPCLAEFRSWLFTFRRSEVFPKPTEFTKEQCDNAAQAHSKIQAEQAQAQEILNAHPSTGDKDEQLVACLREYRIWKRVLPLEVDFESALKRFPPFLVYEAAQCRSARIHNIELEEKALIADALQKQELAKQQQRLDQLKRYEEAKKLERIRVLKLPGVRIGMTEDQVLRQTNWGKPISVNRTTTASGTKEQWVYGEGNYLYFENGKLIAIQN